MKTHNENRPVNRPPVPPLALHEVSGPKRDINEALAKPYLSTTADDAHGISDGTPGDSDARKPEPDARPTEDLGTPISAPDGHLAGIDRIHASIARAMKPSGSTHARSTAAVEVLLPPEVRKPRKDEWVRAVAVPGISGVTFEAIEYEGKRWVVVPELVPNIKAPSFDVRAELMRNSNGKMFLWLLRLPEKDSDNPNRAHVDSEAAANLAQHGWVRLWWNPATMAYVVERPAGTLRGSAVPEGDLTEAVAKSIADLLIDSLEHPVIRKLHGLE